MAATGTNVGMDFTYSAGANMTQWAFVKQSTTADRTVLVATGAAGEAALGICQDDATSGQRTQIRTGGRSIVVYGASVTRGALLTANSSGQAVTYTAATVYTGTPYVVSGTCVYAVAEESGSSGENHMCLLSFRGLNS